MLHYILIYYNFMRKYSNCTFFYKNSIWFKSTLINFVNIRNDNSLMLCFLKILWRYINQRVFCFSYNNCSFQEIHWKQCYI